MERSEYYELEAEKEGYYHFERKKGHTVHPHFHGAYEFLFVESGEQTVIIGGEKRILKAGEACFSDGFCVHSYPVSFDGAVRVLLGERRYFSDAFDLYHNKKPPKFFPFTDFALLDFLEEIAKREYEKEEDRRTVFSGIVKILLGAISQNVEFIEEENDRQSSLICEILKYADEHFADDLSLKTVANKFGYSHEHLSRLLHKYLSENWKMYVDRLRAHKASEQFKRFPERSVLSVALDCGFESANTFYRAYKRAFGFPPKRR